MSATALVMEERIRAALNDDDLSHPVVDVLVLLAIISDCYSNVAAVLGLQPTTMSPNVAGETEVELALQLESLGEVLYSDSGTTDFPLPKQDYETVMRLRGGRSTLPALRPRVFAAREVEGGTTKLFFDTTCPDDATLRVWRAVQAAEVSALTDELHLSSRGLTAVEKMSCVTVLNRIGKAGWDKLGIDGQALRDQYQSQLNMLLHSDKARSNSVELTDRIVQTEN